MSISKAQQKATAKYVRQNYDRIEVKVPKGDKEVLQAHAQAQGESLNKFINRAITEQMVRDTAHKCHKCYYYDSVSLFHEGCGLKQTYPRQLKPHSTAQAADR